MVASATGPVYGLKVPAGDELIAAQNFPVNFRITMAAIDPSAQPKIDPNAADTPMRATLRLVRERLDVDDDDEEDEDELDEDDIDDIEAIKARIAAALSDEEDDDDSSDEGQNGGPSDPSRTKKARKEAALKALKDDMDVDDMPNGVNGTLSKGKAKITDEDDDSQQEDEEEVEEFVICTLDPSKNFQQPLDIFVDESEEIYFKVSGTHAVYLTGNYIFDGPTSKNDDYDDALDYDLSPDEEELDEDSEEESDELDDLDDPRITEIDSDEDAPKLVKGAKADKNAKNKRSADDEEEEEHAQTLDDLIGKSLKPAEPAADGEKLSKKQLKKLKKNDGQAVVTAEEPGTSKKANQDGSAPAKTDKKVQFAKNLELGPTGSPKVDPKSEAKKKEASKSTSEAKVVNGVKIEDKKIGQGKIAKPGSKLGMRYIGKLENGKVFDANKKGKPFSFTLGKGEVIKGWDVGVAGMAVGGERRITVPASLGYGSKKLPDIPANSTLVFDIKLLTIN